MFLLAMLMNKILLKAGGNYAPTMKPAKEAAERGFSQVLWLLNDEVTEVGAMNVFFVFDKGDGSGRKEIVTPPLSRGGKNNRM